MTDQVGVYATLAAATTGGPIYQAGIKGPTFIRDRINVDAAQNDRIFLGSVPSTAIIDPLASKIWFDDTGTSVTMDVGDTTYENALVAAADVAAAAGSVSVIGSIAIENYWKPLWAQLGYSADPGGQIDLYAKLEAANPASSDFAWQIVWAL